MWNIDKMYKVECDLIEGEEGGGEAGGDAEHEEEELLVWPPLPQVDQHLAIHQPQ